MSEKYKTTTHVGFINALRQGYNLRAKKLLRKVKNDLCLLDKEYNLIELIHNSSFNPDIAKKWINKVIHHCSSVVHSSILYNCVLSYDDETVRLLLSYGANPNDMFYDANQRLYGVANPWEKTNGCWNARLILHLLYKWYPNFYGAYWLIIYGLDIFINCQCNICKCNSLIGIFEMRMASNFHEKTRHTISEIKRGIGDMKREIIKYGNYLIIDLLNVVIDYLYN